MITIIRVGTSEGIQKDTELGMQIITDYVVALDNTGLFYNAPYYNGICKILEERIRRSIDIVIPHDSRFKGKIFPYASRARQDVIEALEKEAQKVGIKYKRGVTVSSSGFFANQGRTISRIPSTVTEIDGILASIDTGIEGLKIENMEMEASFLLYLMGALGYKAGTICFVIDNRREDKFAAQYSKYIKDAAKVALKTLYILREGFTENPFKLQGI